MATYIFRLDKLWVRFLAPHPYFLALLAAVLLTSAAAAVEADQDSDTYYSNEPVTMADVISRAVIGRYIYPLGLSIYVNPSTDEVYYFNGTTVPEDQKYAVWAASHVAVAAQTAIDDLAANLEVGTSSLLDAFNYWIPLIYDSVDGNDGLLTNIFNYLDKGSWSFKTFWRDPSDSYREAQFSGSGLLSLIGKGFQELTAADYNNLMYLRSFFKDSAWSFKTFARAGGVYTETSVSGSGLFSLLSRIPQELSGSFYTNMVYMHDSLLGSDNLGSFSFQRIGDDGTIETEEQTANNLLDALALLGTSLQNPLAKLQYVLASDDDIAFKAQEKANTDTAKDSFFGDGAGAVKPSDITDAAGIASGVQDSFSGAGSAGDAFIAISDSNSYSFFSQEVSNALDTVSGSSVRAAAMDDDDFMDGFELGEDGFYHVKDQSPWDVSSFLGG